MSPGSGMGNAFWRPLYVFLGADSRGLPRMTADDRGRPKVEGTEGRKKSEGRKPNFRCIVERRRTRVDSRVHGNSAETGKRDSPSRGRLVTRWRSVRLRGSVLLRNGLVSRA